MSDQVAAGFSTGAVARDDVAAGVDLNTRLGGDLVELSALNEAELPGVTAAIRSGVSEAVARVSIHGPAKGRQLPEADLVAYLDQMSLAAGGAGVVMHPDIFEDLTLWRRLGNRLLVENNDGRKAYGQRSGDLDAIFTVVDQASFCLDVSHALHAGGPSLVTELAGRYPDRLVQLHAGCACGEPLGYTIGADVTAAVADACSTVGHALPVVLERTTPADALAELAGQLNAIRSA